MIMNDNIINDSACFYVFSIRLLTCSQIPRFWFSSQRIELALITHLHDTHTSPHGPPPLNSLPCDTTCEFFNEVKIMAVNKYFYKRRHSFFFFSKKVTFHLESWTGLNSVTYKAVYHHFFPTVSGCKWTYWYRVWVKVRCEASFTCGLTCR